MNIFSTIHKVKAVKIGPAVKHKGGREIDSGKQFKGSYSQNLTIVGDDGSEIILGLNSKTPITIIQ